MLDFGFYNMDCMELMKRYPDKFFDLAVVDPPYSINITGRSQSVNVEREREAGTDTSYANYWKSLPVGGLAR